MKPPLPPLKIEKPCPKQWESMHGDSQRRYCEHCQLHVHNLSAMTGREQEHFIAETTGQACIAYELRPDGTMITPSRWSWLELPFQRVRWSIAAALAAMLPFLFAACAQRRTLGAVCPPEPHKQSAAMTGTVMMLGKPMPPKSE